MGKGWPGGDRPIKAALSLSAVGQVIAHYKHSVYNAEYHSKYGSLVHPCREVSTLDDSTYHPTKVVCKY